jgi:hypothetical protein
VMAVAQAQGANGFQGDKTVQIGVHGTSLGWSVNNDDQLIPA